MEFVDQNGNTILDVPDDAERVDFPDLEDEEMVQEEMERRFPEAAKDLVFDSEGEAFVVLSKSIDAIRLVARCINDLEQGAKT